MLKPLNPRGSNMSDSIRQRVQALGLTLPTPSQPAANYINHVVSQNQLFISGQIPMLDGKPTYIGRLGQSLSDEEGAQAAELAALGLLGQLSAAIGDDLSRVVRILRLGVFIASSGDFTRQSVVANGASIWWSMPWATKAGTCAPPSASRACPPASPWRWTQFSSCCREPAAGPASA